MITERVIGTDGKSYRSKALTPEQRFPLLWWVHYLSHVRHMSIRRIVRELQEQQGMHVSMGTVHKYLNTYTCDLCQG